MFINVQYKHSSKDNRNETSKLYTPVVVKESSNETISKITNPELVTTRRL